MWHPWGVGPVSEVKTNSPGGYRGPGCDVPIPRNSDWSTPAVVVERDGKSVAVKVRELTDADKAWLAKEREQNAPAPSNALSYEKAS